MIMPVSMLQLPIPLAISLVLSAVAFAASSGQKHHTIIVNRAAVDNVRMLIADGHMVMDKRGDWAAHRPGAKEENDFIRQHGLAEYGQWYLAIDESKRDSKARYKFPFGDFRNVHRCALLAVIGRARQHGYLQIEDAARELLALVETKHDQTQRNWRDELVSSYSLTFARKIKWDETSSSLR